jgi:Galactose oxidase-like, Early set domain
VRAYERSPYWQRQMRRAARRAKAFARRHAKLTAADPLDRTGRWAERFDIPVFAINSIVLPTGKILWFAYPYNPDRGDRTTSNYANAWLWDPAKGTGPSSFKQVDPPIDPATGKPVNIWCAGNSLLSDGQVLVTGGNLKYLTDTNSYEGLNHVYTFDPFTETWTQQPDMNHGRWYPSQLLMADGRTFIMGGFDEFGVANKNEDLELFNPPAQRGGQGSISFLGPEGVLDDPGMPTRGDYYPHLFWMPNGRGLVAGPYTNDSWWFDAPANPAAFGPGSWSDIGNSSRSRVWGTAVLVPGGPDGSHQVVQLGGSDLPGGDPMAVASAELFDTATDDWTVHPPGATFALNQPRSHANTVLLPDRSMVEVGGGLGSVSGNGPNGAPGQWAAQDAQKQIELWDPSTQRWRLGPAQREFRTYHSTAVLLPDGRVVSAGDDYNGSTGTATDFTHDTAEIYEPPYLFDGNARARRPAIMSSPQVILPGHSFNIATSASKPAAVKAVLMGPGAATHAVDMNQRYQPLVVTGRSTGRLRVKAPPSYNVALPGYYMLFVLDADGTPSVAAWVHMGALPATTKATKPKVRVRLIRRSGKRFVRVTVARWTKSRVRLRIVLRDRRRHTVRRFTATVRTGRTTTLKARVPGRARSVAASVR